MRVGVKVCGITSIPDARVAVDAGADALGFVFAKSPRRIDVDRAKKLFAYVPPFVTTVAVFRHPSKDDVESVLHSCAPDVVQAEPTSIVATAVPTSTRSLPVFHDGEDSLDSILSFARNRTERTAVLLEAGGRGGRGIAPDWGFAKRIASEVPLVLAGGLTPENVQTAIQNVGPCAVDVSSGVERTPGSKNPQLIREFIAEVRKTEALLKERET